MDVFEAIAERRCYRGIFKDVSIPRDVLVQIIEAGIKAPRIAEVIPTPACKTAKAMIVCVSDSRSVYKGLSFYKEDCAAAVENMLLALTALGYSSVWIDGALRFDQKAEKIAKVLKIPDTKHVQVVLPIGVPLAQEPRTTRLPFTQRASFNTWSNQT